MRVGIDLVVPGRLGRIAGRGWAGGYVFAEQELADAGALTGTRREEFLAGRFAAKEAVLKVLGVGLFDGVAPRDIRLVRTASGAPEVALTGSAARAAARLRLGEVTVSITHAGALAVAVAAAA